MANKESLYPSGTLVDKEIGERFEMILDALSDHYTTTDLVEANQEKHISLDDITAIHFAHHRISPITSNWRLERANKSNDRGEIADASTYSNWEAPGGPLESIDYASDVAYRLVSLLHEHLKPEEEVDDAWKKSWQEVQQIDPLHAAAAGLLHDEGRFLTHTYYTNEMLANPLYRRLGIRKDIVSVLPSEQVMQVLLDESMDDVIRDLNPEAVIVRIADEFGKRFPGTNRLYQPQDYDTWDRQRWADGYMNRSSSGRPTDDYMRKEAVDRNGNGIGMTRMQLHVDNVPRYFTALDNWVRNVSTLTLEDITREIDKELSPTLPLLRESIPLSSDDLVDGVVRQQDIEIGNKQISVEALTHIGGPNKDTNEDAGLVRVEGNSVYAVVVDGGTQVDQVPSLGKKKGGKYIAEQVLAAAQQVEVGRSASQFLRDINRRLAEDESSNHDDILHIEDSMNVPYGSIAAVKLDFEANELEVANAGDVFAIVKRRNGINDLLTRDTVYRKDQRTYQAARASAEIAKVSVREAMEKRDKDERFSPIISEMYETVRQGNTGIIKRIAGFESFTTDLFYGSLDNAEAIYIFSDGVVPLDMNIHTAKGLEDFIDLVDADGLEGVYETVRATQQADSDFEQYPRFRDQDDFLAIKIQL